MKKDKNQETKTGYVFRPSRMYALMRLLFSETMLLACVLMLFPVGLRYLSDEMGYARGIVNSVITYSWVIQSVGVVLMGGKTLYAMWEYLGSRCVCQLSDFVVERGGFSFASDSESWQKVTDADMYQSFFEQLTGSGTIEIEIDGKRKVNLAHYGKPRYLRNFFREKANENFRNATRINTV